jgi:DNA polymerase
LADAAAALGLPIKKDTEGRKVMLRLCKPLPSGQFDNERHRRLRLYDYCKQDVRAEVALSRAIPPLEGRELKLWQLDQRINLRGIPVDVHGVRDALEVLESHLEDCESRLAKLTGGAVKTPKQVSAMRQWILDRTGKVIPDLTAETVRVWLAKDIHDDVAEVLQIRQDTALASTAKLKAIAQRVDRDGRVRGNLVYHGAATGRWAGAGIQIQNFPRGTLSPKEIELVHRLIASRDSGVFSLLFGSPMAALSSSLRSFVRAEQGKKLLACDFAAIEARVLAWLAGEQELLDTFSGGDDVYKAMAAKIYSVDVSEVTKVQRHVGKTAILGLGYGMGARAFRDACEMMAKVTLDMKMANLVVKTYRQANPAIKNFWSNLNAACIEAIRSKEPYRCGLLEVTCSDGWLRIELPSGRKLHYRSPKLVQVLAPWSDGYTGIIYGKAEDRTRFEDMGIELGEHKGTRFEDCTVPTRVAALASGLLFMELERMDPIYIDQIEYMAVDSTTRKWSPTRTYGGKLVENVTQAVARDFLAEAMLRVESRGYAIIATIHDEILSEVFDEPDWNLMEFESLMRAVPTWGQGCPIAVEGFVAERYRK